MYQTPMSLVLDDGKTYDAISFEKIQFNNGRSDIDKRKSMIQLTAFANGIIRVRPVIIRVRVAMIGPSDLQIY